MTTHDWEEPSWGNFKKFFFEKITDSNNAEENKQLEKLVNFALPQKPTFGQPTNKEKTSC